jgi:hypothetical protein
LPRCRSGGSGLQYVLLRRAARQRQPGRKEKLDSHAWRSLLARIEVTVTARDSNPAGILLLIDHVSDPIDKS